ncbi:MAG: ABC transporter ATP-binding protein, partial [Muribaculaceae bacterium]|nr:ABC transporter ATP-binding protein [Muribaculaceae bacterium]
MKGFFRLLVRFVPPYKRYLCLNILFNLLTAVLTLFSFALIIPILEMLFGLNTNHYDFMALGSGSLQDVVVNDFY